MVDQQQEAARLHHAVDLVQHPAHVVLRPVVFRILIDPVEVVVNLDEQDGIERVCGEIQVLGIDGAMLDVWQPALDTLLPVTLAPGVIGEVS